MLKRFIGEIREGKISYANQSYVNHHLSKFKDGKVMVTVETPKNYRSLPQNRLYWLYLNFITEQTGQDANDLHLYFKAKYLAKRQIDLFGTNVRMSGTTTTLSKGEFIEYIEKITQFVTKFGITLPDYKDPDLASLINEM